MWKFFTYKGQRVPDHPLGPFQLSPQAYEAARQDALRVAWLGHSSYLLQAGGKRFILDPVWSRRASPVAFMGPERFFDAPVAPEQLPPLDGIILTHDHYDHLDERMIRLLIGKKIPFFCPLGVDGHLLKWGADKALITVFDWWQEREIMNGIRLTATPARHFSGRGLQRNRTLWTSYLLEAAGRKVFIGGDSGYFFQHVVAGFHRWKRLCRFKAIGLHIFDLLFLPSPAEIVGGSSASLHHTSPGA